MSASMLVLLLIFQLGNYGVAGNYVPHMDRNSKKEVEQYRNNPAYYGNLLASILIILKAPKAGILILRRLGFIYIV